METKGISLREVCGYSPVAVHVVDMCGDFIHVLERCNYSGDRAFEVVNLEDVFSPDLKSFLEAVRVGQEDSHPNHFRNWRQYCGIDEVVDECPDIDHGDDHWDWIQEELEQEK